MVHVTPEDRVRLVRELRNLIKAVAKDDAHTILNPIQGSPEEGLQAQSRPRDRKIRSRARKASPAAFDTGVRGPETRSGCFGRTAGSLMNSLMNMTGVAVPGRVRAAEMKPGSNASGDSPSVTH